MPYRSTPLVTDGYYHIYNRGIAKHKIFSTSRDYQRFIQTFFYYQIQNPKPKFSHRGSLLYKIDSTKKVLNILCYCLMPNHFHLLVKQTQNDGISEFMRKFVHSYTKYWNIKNKTQGPLIQAMFKAVPIESDEQLLHVSRYIHLNPLVSGVVDDLKIYPWSSYNLYTGLDNNSAVDKADLLNFFENSKDYEKFVLDQADYGTTLELLKHSTLDIEE